MTAEESLGRERGFEKGRLFEVAACAELVRAAGCLCVQLEVYYPEQFKGAWTWVDMKRVFNPHDPRCPHALAAAIEARRG